MIQRILSAKHWQVFIALFALPMLIHFLFVGSISKTIVLDGEPQIEEILNFIQVLPFIIILFVGMLFAWLWSVAIGLQYKVPQSIRFNTKRFKVFFFIPLFYVIAISFGMVYLVNMGMNGALESQFNPTIILAIIPLHLFSIFAILYCFYFAAKVLKSAELGRMAKGDEFIGEFFLIWFYPVGVWLLQPRINNLVSSESQQDDYLIE